MWDANKKFLYIGFTVAEAVAYERQMVQMR